MDHSMSAFDPSVFLDAQVDQVSERRPPLPIENPASGDGLYTGLVGEIKTKTGTMEKGDNAGKAWMQVSIPIQIDVPTQVQEEHKVPKQITLTDSGFVDFIYGPNGQPIGFDMAPGRNRFMMKWRNATGNNVAGQSFAWRMLTGRPVKLKIDWRMVESNGESFPVEDIRAILKA